MIISAKFSFSIISGSRPEWDRPESPGVSPNRGIRNDQMYGTMDTLDLIPHTFSQNDVSTGQRGIQINKEINR